MALRVTSPDITEAASPIAVSGSCGDDICRGLVLREEPDSADPTLPRTGRPIWGRCLREGEDERDDGERASCESETSSERLRECVMRRRIDAAMMGAV